MPPLEDFDLLQCAVFWPILSVDEYADPVLGMPVQLDVRWVPQSQIVLTPQGNSISVDTTVIVNDDIEQFAIEGQPFYSTVIGGMMILGGLYDIPGTDFTPVGSIYQIKTFQRTPDLKNRFMRRVLGLLRYTDTLPEVVASN